MDVDTGLRQIDEAEAKYVGSREYERTREEYRQTFEEAWRIAADDDAGEGVDPGRVAADLTRWIDEYVREEKSLPPMGSVDRRTSEILEEAGAAIPPESYLAPA